MWPTRDASAPESEVRWTIFAVLSLASPGTGNNIARNRGRRALTCKLGLPAVAVKDGQESWLPRVAFLT
jgi:hypothetical protein